MKEIQVTSGESGRRLDKFLDKYLSGAGKSFIYKMLRKKNIVLNDKKATGSEILEEGDNIKLYFSDETLTKFTAKEIEKTSSYELDIIYEDDDFLFLNKPAGMLSQKAKASDVSLCEHIVSYVEESLGKEALRSFTPSVCNRLDRNVSGLITAGKTIKGLQELSKAFNDRSVSKYYLAIVKGRFDKNTSFEGYLTKDDKSNKVSISLSESDDSDYIKTEIIPLDNNEEYSLVKVRLITGKTHQIRATLSYLGHPIVGDRKYGYTGIKAFRPMLHSFELYFNRKLYTAPLPQDFKDVLAYANLKL